MQADEAEAERLLHAESDVHRLHAVPRRALHEVVDRAERDHAVATRVDREADVGEVRAREELRLGVTEDARALLHDAHEGLRGVALAIDLPEILVLERSLDRHMRGREDATNELDGGDRQVDARLVAA